MESFGKKINNKPPFFLQYQSFSIVSALRHIIEEACGRDEGDYSSMCLCTAMIAIELRSSIISLV